MPLKRLDPDVQALIAYIVDRSRNRGVTLTRTKLIKLLYLLDVERVSTRREPLTGAEWIFFHYGPWAAELSETIKAMEGTSLIAEPYYGSTLYRFAPDAPDGADWPAGTKMTIDHTVDEWGGVELNELLDHVYFHTGPMIDAKRGEPLDMSLARDYRERSYPPLRAKSAAGELEERLGAWRERNAARFSYAQMDPPLQYLEIPEEGHDVPTATGTLHVPDDTWI